MKIENLIETDYTRRERSRGLLTKAQYFCFGMTASFLVGYADAWWRTVQTSILFVFVALVLGVCKARTGRRVWSHRAKRPVVYVLPQQNGG